MGPRSFWVEVVKINNRLVLLPRANHFILKLCPLNSCLWYFYLRNIHGSVPECNSKPPDKCYSSSWNFHSKHLMRKRNISSEMYIYIKMKSWNVFYRNYIFSTEPFRFYPQDVQSRHSFSPAPNWGKSFKVLFQCINRERHLKPELLHRPDSLLQCLADLWEGQV